MNFQFEGDDKSIAMVIVNTRDRIEYYINPPKSRIGIKYSVMIAFAKLILNNPDSYWHRITIEDFLFYWTLQATMLFIDPRN